MLTKFQYETENHREAGPPSEPLHTTILFGASALTLHATALAIALLPIIGFPLSIAAQTGPGYALSFAGTGGLMAIGGSPVSVPWTAELRVNRQDSPAYSSVLLVDGSIALKLEQYNFNRKVGFSRFGVADYVFNYTAPVGILQKVEKDFTVPLAFWNGIDATDDQIVSL